MAVEAIYAGACYDILESHKHRCADVDALCLSREMWQDDRMRGLVREQIAADPMNSLMAEN